MIGLLLVLAVVLFIFGMATPAKWLLAVALVLIILALLGGNGRW